MLTDGDYYQQWRTTLELIYVYPFPRLTKETKKAGCVSTEFVIDLVTKLYRLVRKNDLQWTVPHIQNDGQGLMMLSWLNADETKALGILVSLLGDVDYLYACDPGVREIIKEPSDDKLIELWKAVHL